ncbi:hypothetical protein [Membranihabitans maritimus]|uniref:hypothetical protein n=1 Tax=Membranihabitans maritimus TaxID=2904244 RepID=UPI001F1969F4|nr:hypothetical protein [Membranihabitans maritimus]
MKPLESSYVEHLKELKSKIQESNLLENYLESEEESDYKEMSDLFEPRIQELYDEVAKNHPLELITLEEELMDEAFEGLFLPRILGYSVLRGAINDDYKYIRPQEQFQKILSTICDSVHFDFIKNRIGQTVQMGFALNSDIWTTSFINNMPNKRVVNYLKSLKSQKLWLLHDRKLAYNKYQRQFGDHNFYTIDFPEDRIELIASYGQFVNFLKYRITNDLDNSSFIEDLVVFLEDLNVYGNQEFVDILGLCIHYIRFEGEEEKRVAKVLNGLRKENNNFEEMHFHFIERLLSSEMQVQSDSYAKVYNILSDNPSDDLFSFYYVQNIIHENGLASETSIEEVKSVYNAHEGLSEFNEALRLAIFNYFQSEMETMQPKDYPDYFELNKLLLTYTNLFDNQQFNQQVKESCIKFVKSCIKVFTDKRGKNYQEVKKFVLGQFQNLFSMKEKEILEIFKTRKKKKASRVR